MDPVDRHSAVQGMPFRATTKDVVRQTQPTISHEVIEKSSLSASTIIYQQLNSHTDTHKIEISTRGQIFTHPKRLCLLTLNFSETDKNCQISPTGSNVISKALSPWSLISGVKNVLEKTHTYISAVESTYWRDQLSIMIETINSQIHLIPMKMPFSCLQWSFNFYV